MHDDYADTPRLVIAGREHQDWLRYSVDSDFFTPADGWHISLGLPAGRMPAYLHPWAACELYMGDDLVMTGRVDSIRRRISKGQHALELAGRDLAAVLLDCSAPIFVQREADLPQVVATIVRPLGITKVEIQGKATFEKITVEPGMTAWDALQRAAEASGLWPWFTPDGTLKVAAPDYTTPVAADLILRMDADATQNNLLELDLVEDYSKCYSEVTVLGQSTGDEDDEGDNTIKATIRDRTFPGYRPLIRDEGHIDTHEKARTRARKIITDGIFSDTEIHAVVRGHRTEAGILWEPGMRIHVLSQPHRLEGIYYLTKRTFQRSRDGKSAALTLRPDGVWLPDTARKPKGKKQKDDDDDW